MQASQNRNVVDPLQSDLHSSLPIDPQPAFPSVLPSRGPLGTRSDPTFIRSFVAPFSAPIEAARKYLGRQRDDASQAGGRQPLPRQIGAATSAEDRGSRERDRRLERSLYEGHSIEAGLNFDLPEAFESGIRVSHADDEFEAAGFDFAEPGYGDQAHTGRAYPQLRDSEPGDSFGPLSPQGDFGSGPRPDEVRGAILRLTRQADLPQDLSPGTRSTASVAASVAACFNASWQGGDAAPPLDFRDVARRVWSSGGADAGVPPPLSKVDNGGVGSYPRAAFAISAPPQSAPVATEAAYHPAHVDDALDDPQTAAPADAGRAGDSVAGVESPVADASPSRAEEMSALAHDTCNLLSALRLYGELLASPGVLRACHRHYADELLLIATRSDVLMGRLLRSAGANAIFNLPGRATACSVPECEIEAQVAKVDEIEPRSVRAEPIAPEPIARSIPAGAPGTASAAPATTSAPPAGPVPHPANPVDVLLRWRGLLSTLAQGRLELDLGDPVSVFVPAGVDALERILVNLVRNATVATAAGGSIRIRAAIVQTETQVGPPPDMFGAIPDRMAGTAFDRSVLLTIDDSGCGMGETQVRRLLGSEPPAERIGAIVDERMSEAHVSEAHVSEAHVSETHVSGEVATDALLAIAGGSQTAIRSPLSTTGNSSEGYGRWSHGASSPHGGSDGKETVAAEETGVTGVTEGSRRRGIGLRIVRELVAASQGTLSIQSWPGRGTRVEVRWPVVTSSVPALAVDSSSLDDETRGADRSARPDATLPPQGSLRPLWAAHPRPLVSEALVSPNYLSRPPLSQSAVPTADLPAPISGLGTSSLEPWIGIDPERSTVGAAPSRRPEIVEDRSSAGPDGFTEAELRAMIARMNRAGPNSRRPLSRRIGDGRRSAEVKSAQRFDVRKSPVPEDGRRVAQDFSAQQEVIVKGAIAC